jgi:hypothetical protein
MSSPFSMPPVDEETAASALWLHAMEEVAPKLGAMVFDFAGRCSEGKATNLLLVGLQKIWMDRVLAMAGACKLKLIAVMPTEAAACDATALHVDHALILWMHGEGAELAGQEAGEIRMLRHMGAADASPPLLAALRRAAASSNNHSSPSLVIWDDAGLENSQSEAIRAAVGLEIIEAKPEWTYVNGVNQWRGGRGLAAVALTMADRTDQRPSLDFLHPRLKAPRQMRQWGSRAFWIAVSTAAVVLLALIGWADHSHLDGQIEETNAQLASMQTALNTATPFVASMKFAETFRPDAPRYVPCLCDLAQALGSDAATRFTSFNLQADLKGSVTGHTGGEQGLLNFVDKLNKGGRFLEVNPRLDSPQGRGGGEVTFTVSFVYVPKS